MSQMRTTQILESVIGRTDGHQVVAIEDGLYNSSVPVTVTGDVTDEVVIPAVAGKKIVIRTILLQGEGNIGEAKINCDGVTYLPLYFTVQARAITSPSLRLVMPENKAVTLTTTGRVANETFAGITYYYQEV